ncbi:hypothetical protein GGR02_001588 [Anoxybacillus voinovskiensis]|uniref:RadC-like JAB domain-containing protein n=1 Tax=Anoxybacteroides voinovskiense TaxID=230470 RepID=A0A840DXR1_9BACL|nr:hypothetical protein [Anoxybacillus voinovskiensis]GGJ81191.1 hypothetical protein GCM10008982_33310 [Anoxybacillus voinovskiensis]
MQSAKRVNIVSLKLVREGSVLYRGRRVQSPEDAYQLLKPFLADADREVFVVVCLDTKNQPAAGCHPRLPCREFECKHCSSTRGVQVGDFGKRGVGVSGAQSSIDRPDTVKGRH